MNSGLATLNYLMKNESNPENAEEGTIRKLFALNVQENSVHGSDSTENAIKEINFFFDDNEIVG